MHTADTIMTGTGHKHHVHVKTTTTTILISRILSLDWGGKMLQKANQRSKDCKGIKHHYKELQTSPDD